MLERAKAGDNLGGVLQAIDRLQKGTVLLTGLLETQQASEPRSFADLARRARAQQSRMITRSGWAENSSYPIASGSATATVTTSQNSELKADVSARGEVANVKRILAMMLLLTACAIHQSVEPIRGHTIEQICVMQNTDVRADLHSLILNEIQDVGIEINVIPADTDSSHCEYKLLYRGAWATDFKEYLFFVDLRVYRSGVLLGRSVYSAEQAAGNTRKFTDPQRKIKELVRGLFGASDSLRPGARTPEALEGDRVE